MSHTIPEHHGDNRKLLINQSGSWATMLRFEQHNEGQLAAILVTAANLVRLSGHRKTATMKLVDKDGIALQTWSDDTDWVEKKGR